MRLRNFKLELWERQSFGSVKNGQFKEAAFMPETTNQRQSRVANVRTKVQTLLTETDSRALGFSEKVLTLKNFHRLVLDYRQKVVINAGNSAAGQFTKKEGFDFFRKITRSFNRVNFTVEKSSGLQESTATADAEFYQNRKKIKILKDKRSFFCQERFTMSASQIDHLSNKSVLSAAAP